MTSTNRPGAPRSTRAAKGKQVRQKPAPNKRVLKKPAAKRQASKAAPKAGPVRKGSRSNFAGGFGPSEPMRIAKAMARAGLCSRRDAERWIEEGRVKLNGKLLKTPAIEVGPKDRIIVDGKPLPAQEPVRLWRYHKPRGYVTTHRDPQDRATVFDALPPELPRVISVGRLDYNTEGLLLLTNDGALARYLELPATGWMRRYRVRAFGRVSQAELDALKDGVTIEGVRYGPVSAVVDSVQGGNTWLTLGLREGKNREVRRILEHLDLKVNRLIRISYGPFQLMDLKPGSVELVRRKVIADQLGPEVAQDLNLGNDADEDGERRGPMRGRMTPRSRATSGEGAKGRPKRGGTVQKPRSDRDEKTPKSRHKRGSAADRSIRKGGDIVDKPKAKRSDGAASGLKRGDSNAQTRRSKGGGGSQQRPKRSGASRPGAKRGGPSPRSGKSRAGPRVGPGSGPRGGPRGRAGR